VNDRPRRTILNATSWKRFATSMADLGKSPRGPRAKLAFAGLLGLLLLLNGLNVISSYVGRDFMTAIASRDYGAFFVQTVRYIAVLLALTATATFIRFAEERLALFWRAFLTNRLVGLYISQRLYHRLGSSQSIGNVDQRIADDVKQFTTMMVSFVVLFVNAGITILAFSGVLWSISHVLFFVAVGYAALGSGIIFWFGRPLIWLNYNQLDREAEFRADLVQLRENSEFVALAHHEEHFRHRLSERIHKLVSNYRRLISINRNVNSVTNGYNYFIPAIPVFFVAPMYIRGEIEFGVITQSTIAFAQLIGGFSLIVTQFQTITSFTAVLARLDHFSEATHEMDDAPPPAIEVTEGDDALVFEHLTLTSPEDAKDLVRDLSLRIDRGRRLLVTGPGETAKMALFRATGLLWDHGSGRIVRPGGTCMCFLPERPYLPPGTLRQILLGPDCAGRPTEERIHELIDKLELRNAIDRIGGFDVERDWDDILSLGELQRLAAMRVLLVAPHFAFLDRLETTLEPERLQRVIDLMRDGGITYITISRGIAHLPDYDLVLELSGEGPWTLHSARESSSEVAAKAS
jgi:putative ATP-binding cassette transporter